MAKRQLKFKKCEGCQRRFSFMAFDVEVNDRVFCTMACANKSNAYRNSRSKLGSKNPMFGKKPHNYKGGIVKNKSGSRKVKYLGVVVPLHRRVMELHLGRVLKDDEVVHHKDGNGLNNEISNLQLMTKSEHSKLHAKEIARDSRSRFIKK